MVPSKRNAIEAFNSLFATKPPCGLTLLEHSQVEASDKPGMVAKLRSGKLARCASGTKCSFLASPLFAAFAQFFQYFCQLNTARCCNRNRGGRGSHKGQGDQ